MNTLLHHLVLWYLRRQPPIIVVCRYRAVHLFLPDEVHESITPVNLGDLYATGRYVVNTTFHGLGAASFTLNDGDGSA